MGNSGSIVTAHDRAVLDLKLQRDKLRAYQRKLSVVAEREDAVAREALRSRNRRTALLALRKKKYQEGLLHQTDAQLEALQQLVASIEFALIEKDVVFGLKQGNSVLTRLNQELALENVDKLMLDSSDAIAYQNQVDAALSDSLSAGDELDVQHELDALQHQLRANDVSLPSAPHHAPSLPAQPEGTPQEATREEVTREEATPQMLPS